MLLQPLSHFLAYFGLLSDDSSVIRGFAVDSRKVEEGFVFFALKGGKVDGHDFINHAFDKGAIAAVVERGFCPDHISKPLIFVDDVLDSMQGLAKNVLSKVSAKIVAITGSMGKTTTKEFCHALLSRKFKVFKTPGNANSQIGLPLSILNQKSFDFDVLIFEMGMTGRGHISKLVDIAPPDVALITKIAPAHLEFFSDGLEGIAAAKAEILSSPKTSLAVVECEAARYRAIASSLRMPTLLYGKTAKSPDYHLKEEGAHIYIEGGGQMSPEMFLQDIPMHLRENYLAAALAARHFNMSWQEIAEGSKYIGSYEKRYQLIERAGTTFISDCYNANPESMKAAFMSMPAPTGEGRKIAALGPMVELGALSSSLHKEVGIACSQVVDVLFCLGERCLPMKEGFEMQGKSAHHFSDLDRMKKMLLSFVRPGDVVLVKASNSIGLWKLLDPGEEIPPK